jgi:hypothetical protein
MGRAFAEMASETDYIKLLLLRSEKGPDRCLHALRATADYYGWTQKFKIWRPKTIAVSGGYQLSHSPNRSGRCVAQGGKRIRICRGESRQGNPARLTNQFTVSNSCRTFDLAELANFTQGDWYWMEDLSGTRVSKEHWAEIYAASGRTRRRGLVSV